MTRYIVVFFMLVGVFVTVSQPAYALTLNLSTFAMGQCGSAGEGNNTNPAYAVQTSIDLGCNGDSCITKNSKAYYCKYPHNPIIDLLFAIIRLLSDGVGLVIIASLIIAGVQYTFSRGEPQSIANASKRIQSSATALLIFILAYALLNYVVPNGLFGQ